MRSVLARFTRFCVEKFFVKNWVGGEKMTNMMYGDGMDGSLDGINIFVFNAIAVAQMILLHILEPFMIRLLFHRLLQSLFQSIIT